MNLSLAVQIILIALPTYLIRFKIGPIPTTVLELLIMALTVYWLAVNYKVLLTKIITWFKKYSLNNFNYEAIAWVAIAIIAAGVSHFSLDSLGILKAYFIEPVIFYFIVNDVFAGKSKAKLIWPLAIGAGVTAVLALFQKATGLLVNPEFCNTTACRATAWYGYPNAVGLYLEIIIPLLVGLLFIVKDKRQKIYLSAIVILSLGGILAARSRGALVGLAAGAIWFIFVYKKAWRKTLVVISASLAAVVIVLAVIIPWNNNAISRYVDTSLSAQVRLHQWSETWQMLTDGRIISGAGLANYQTTIKPYHDDYILYNKTNDPNYRAKITFELKKYKETFVKFVEIYLYPHNIILNFWSELGLLGLLLFVWLKVKFFIQIKNKAKNNLLALAAGVAMITLIIHGLVDVPYFKNDLAIMFWLLLAII